MKKPKEQIKSKHWIYCRGKGGRSQATGHLNSLAFIVILGAQIPLQVYTGLTNKSPMQPGDKVSNSVHIPRLLPPIQGTIKDVVWNYISTINIAY